MNSPRGALRRCLAVSPAFLVLGLLATLTASANHVPPTVRDVDMGNIAPGERELSIAVDPNNPDVLAAGSNQRPGTQSFFVSTNGGRSWTNGALPNGTLTVPGTTITLMSDPSLDFGSNGEIYYSALMHGNTGEPGTLFVTVSQNQGGVWSDPASGIVAAGTTGPTVVQDKEHIAVDRANGDNVYVAWTPIGGTNNQQVVFSRDLNGISDGLAFSAPVVLSTGLGSCLNQGADFALDGANHIYVAWTSFCSGFADADPGTVYVVRSDNQGMSWTAPVVAATLVNVDLAIVSRTRSHPSIAADPVTGRAFVVYTTYANTTTNTDPDVMIVSSPDGTAGSWTTPARVNQDAGTTEQFLPWIAVGNGRIHVNFHTRAADATNINMDLAYAPVSATPSFTEIQVSSASTPTSTGFLGDYTGNFVGSDDVVHPAWGDGRAGVGGSTDAFTARVNFSPPSELAVLPVAPTQEVGIAVTFTATVTGAHGETETLIPVTFTVLSAGAPSSGGTSGTTNSSGQVLFTYTNTVTGTDMLHVFADLDEDGVEDAGETVDTPVTWIAGPPATLVVTPATATNIVDGTHTVTAEVRDQFNNLVPGALVRFSVAGANAVFGEPTSGSGVTSAAGLATFTYVGRMPGNDTLTAFADFNGDGVRDFAPSAHEPQGTALKTWTLPASTPRSEVEGEDGRIVTLTGARATFDFEGEFEGKHHPHLEGHLRYRDRGIPGRRVKGLTIDAVVVNGKEGMVFGTATVNGGGSFAFRIDAKDNSKKGKTDTFRLRMSDGYDSGNAVLKDGNIEVELED